MELSDKRRWYVPCHHCGEAHPLQWENVKYEQNPAANHPVFGSWIPASARYACPGCGGLWNDAEKNRNVRRAYELQRQGNPGVGWVPTAPFDGVAGFYFNELMSGFQKSALVRLVEKYLIAKHALESEGDVTKMIAFWNATLGLPWEYKANVPEPELLANRAEDYPEWMIPWGGLVLTIGVDVQHNRLAVKIKAWGRGEESWLIWAGELHGNVLQDDVWNELDRVATFRVYKHVSGADLTISAASIDSSDGQTADAVYRYVRRTNRKFGAARVMAIKGSTSDKAEIFRAPAAPLDVNAQHKAAKHGLRPYMAGVSHAKDLILGADENAGRLNLQDPEGKTGRGPQRMHFYRGTRADYFEQLTSEVKAPARNQPRGKKVWQKKAGKRNEFLDCEVYALHAARALRIDTWAEARWHDLEQAILQANLFAPKQEASVAPAIDASVPTPPAAEDLGPAVQTSESEAGSPPAPLLPAAQAQVQALVAPQRPIRRMRHRGVTS
jgi:phage terminase large subunit GpA-like protein